MNNKKVNINNNKKGNINVSIGNYMDIKKEENNVDNNKNNKNKINKSVTGYIDISKRNGSMMNSDEVDFIKGEKKIIEEEGQIGCIIC